MAARAAGRKRFRPDPNRDAFLASYPRSGNTWMRAVVFEVVSGRPAASLLDLDVAVPDAHDPPERRRMTATDRRVVKTHVMHRQAFARALYILRDPVDAIESYLRFQARTGGRPIEPARFVRDALLGRVWPGGWSEHVLSWTRARTPSDAFFAVVRYEDLMRGDPEATARLAAFLDADPDRVAEVLRRTDMAFMRGLEKAGAKPRLKRAGEDWFIGGPKDASVKDLIREEIPRVRPEVADVAAEFGYAIERAVETADGRRS
jgi:hypothetical protein